MQKSAERFSGVGTGLERSLRKTAVAAVLGAGMALAASHASAVVVYSGVLNLTVPSTSAGIYLNLINGVFATAPAGAPGWDLNPWGTSSFNVWANNAAETSNGVISGAGSSTTLVDNLPVGYIVDGTGVFARTGSSETTGATAFNLNSSNNYIGFRFQDGANTYFGWARFSLSTSAFSQPRVLVDYAFESSGGGIAVGAVPEPGTYGLMGLGAAAVLLAARRRKQG
jgi:uncharacterized protein YcnI